MIQKAIHILKVVAWVSMALGILLVLPLLATTILAVKENYWPPLVGVTVAFLVFLGGGIIGLKHAKRPGLNATEVLSLVGGFVAGLFGCAFAALAVSQAIGASGESYYVLYLIFFSVEAVLYIVATVLYSGKRLLPGSTLMIIAGVLSIPVGILALIVAFQIRKATRETSGTINLRLKQILSIMGPFIGLGLIIILFGFIVPSRFLTFYNFLTVANQTVIVALAAMGMTYIIISGGIDLSVGSVIALTTVVTALLVNMGMSPLFSAVAGVLAGMVCGMVSGLLIGGLGIIPFIATLGMMGIARGVAKWLANEQKVDAPMTWLWELMTSSPKWKWMLVSPGVWLMILSAVVVAVILRYALFGRYTFAIGSNESTARLCGIRVERMKFFIYTFGGFMTGLAGLMQFSRLTVGDPTVAAGRELDVIAAVVIGGGSLSGGEGSILGTMIGAFIMAFLRNGCNMTGIPNYVQEIIIGVIIIGAVAIDKLRHRKTE